MSDPEAQPSGASIVLTIDGQKVTGRIVEAHPEKLVVRVPIDQPAKGFFGMQARAVLPDGEIVKFDLGKQAVFAELVIDVPLPEPAEEPEPEAKPSEKRKFFRMNVALPIEVVENDGYHKEVVKARGTTINVSGGGMMVDLEAALMPGVYKFRILLPGEPLTIAGRVFRKPDLAATVMPVEFVDIHEVERTKLIRLLFNRMRNLKDPGEAGPEAAAHPPKDGKEGDEPRYWRRREKFYKPGRIRYW